MADQQPRILLLSDFNAENLGALLANSSDNPALDPITPDFGKGLEILFVRNHAIWDDQPDYAFVWTRAEGVLKSFQRLLDGDTVSHEDVIAEVEEFADQILAASEKVRAMFVATWTLPFFRRGLGMLDMRPGQGHAYLLMKMNIALADRLANSDKVFLLNAERWMAKAGEKGYSSKHWYRGKVPYGHEVFTEAVKDLKAGIRGLIGQACKLIVLDLDNTCWGGIIGDDGMEGIHLGGHDPEGEAFVDFQHRVKELTKRGIVLGIASKNEESVAMECIQNHSEMVLRKDDFASWRINWHDKAANIADLVKEINLGLQSVVFIDDNPTERGRVREALPEVHVPEWPKKAVDYPRAFLELALFDLPSISEEDRKRAQMYTAERKRTELQDGADMDTWLAKLEIQAEIEEINDANQQRTSQLLNKTNQMNLTTRRLTLEELQDWLSVEGNELWTVRVSDRFGEYGLTGIVSVHKVSEDEWQLVDFILSCRVFGKNIEDTMLHIAINHAANNGAKVLVAKYLETKKNKPCRSFFERSGMDQEDDTFTWDCSKAHPVPKYVDIVYK